MTGVVLSVALSDPIGWTDRVTRLNATALTALSMLLLMWGITGKRLLRWFLRAVFVITAGHYGAANAGVEAMREHNPAFTGVYKRYLAPSQVQFDATAAARASLGVDDDDEELPPLDCHRILTCRCFARDELEYFNAAKASAAKAKQRQRLLEEIRRQQAELEAGRRQDDDSDGEEPAGTKVGDGMVLDENGDVEFKRDRRGGAGLAEETFDVYASDSGNDSDDSQLFAGVIGVEAAVAAAKARADKRRRLREAAAERKRQANALKSLMEPEYRVVDTNAPGGYVLRQMVWSRKGDVDGVPHAKGQRLRTWEVLRMNGVESTYDLHQQQGYQVCPTLAVGAMIGCVHTAECLLWGVHGAEHRCHCRRSELGGGVGKVRQRVRASGLAIPCHRGLDGQPATVLGPDATAYAATSYHATRPAGDLGRHICLRNDQCKLACP